ncbi:transcriptional regulator [Actinomyces trachealis]|uniref:transcriptional regulator n=1 Tax=Actinomyces trachealis TaxID=2763540 RepID=UPI0018C7FBE1|nr:transcriptional regulator [Actinomyces trachealis]
MSQTRLRFRDVKPYEAPDSLHELSGPSSGPVTLPLRIRWVPGDRTYDVSNDAQAQIVYQAVLAEGTAADQCSFLNAQRLIELWPTLSLDQRVVELWQGRFGELRGLKWPTRLVTNNVA